MPRRKISEFRSKKIVNETLNLPYVGWSIVDGEVGSTGISSISGYRTYVIKVDQAVKGRFKKGLVLLDKKKKDIGDAINTLRQKGYHSFIVEPYVEHEIKTEKYLSLVRDRRGLWLSYSAEGGVDIESKSNTVVTRLINGETDWESLADKTQLTLSMLRALVKVFRDNYLVFLEINPYTSIDGQITILDCAIEVDDAGMYLTRAWTEEDIRTAKVAHASPEEITVRNLDANSPASFNLSVLNPNGSIFLLLSGGGASIVIADEVYNRGYGHRLANYGEYSGNPNSHEAYLYTVEVMKVLFSSSAKQKVVFIGGAVANFTDIASTFAGVIQAIEEFSQKLIKQGVKVYVRRGGPRQEIGLAKMHEILEKYDLLGGVYGPSTTITDALSAALRGLRK